MISQQLQTNETQEQFLLRQGMAYSQLLKETFQQIFNIELVVETPVLQPEGIRSSKDISVSVLFTGTVYGEYVLTVNEATAYQLIGKSAQDIQTQNPAVLRDEVGDALCELLNLVVGQAVVGISQKHNKLTITSPKIS
ncbi:MAG: chemotaxis protein CheX, partial [Bdellovibrionota bacterium]